MTIQRNRTRLALGIVFASFCANSPALADPPEGKGKGKGKGHDRGRDEDHGNREKSGAGGKGGKGGPAPTQGGYFVEQHRAHVRVYFANEQKRGFCPPGLAKKNNGCMPPGQTKKWHIGQPLPRDLVIYDLPPNLVVQIGMPPAGYKYVRVAADILLIAIGTSMVVDAIRDLGQL